MSKFLSYEDRMIIAQRLQENASFGAIGSTHIYTVHLQTIRRVLIGDTCKACIGIGIISKHIEPCTDWELRDNYSWYSPISGVKNFKEIPAFIKIKIHKTEIIDHKQIQFGQLIQVIQICGFDACLFHFAHKSVRFYILYTLRLLHCSYYNQFFYDSGEAYAKIKAKMDIEENEVYHRKIVEIGHSIKMEIQENNLDGVLNVISFVEQTMTKDEVQKIPVFYKVKDETEIQELDKRLGEKIEENIECVNISELDIIGATEVFNNNDISFVLKYKRKNKNVQQLTKENILEFISENGLNLKNDFLDIKVVSNKDGNPVRTDTMKRLIDFTDDEKKCLLLKGEWYYYNDDYIEYLSDSIDQLDVIYEPRYDFGKQKLIEYQDKQYQIQKDLPEYAGVSADKIKKKIQDTYYAESAFNHYMSDNYAFTIYDRVSPNQW